MTATVHDFYDWQADAGMNEHAEQHNVDPDAATQGARVYDITAARAHFHAARTPGVYMSPDELAELQAAGLESTDGIVSAAGQVPAVDLPFIVPEPYPVDDPFIVPEPAASVPPPALHRRAYRRVVATVTHPSARAVYRQGVYVIAGAHVARDRRRDERGTARHERMMRAAELAGDHAAVQEWAVLAAAHRQARHERRVAMRNHPIHVAKKTAVYGGLTVAGLLTIGIALAITGKGGPREVYAPLVDAFDLVRWAFEVIDVLWLPAVLLTPAFVVASWWQKGRTRAEVPPWLMSAAQREQYEGEPITPSIVVTALRDLGLGELRKQIKAMPDAGAAMLSPIRAAGCGVELDVMLPSGTSTAEIQARRQKLAENLGRHRHEVFITIPPAPRTVRLWIADSGALDEPIGPSPLVTDETATADYRTGRAPWGQDLRGGTALISLFQRHLLVTGLSNQGKTASLRALMLWLALDPRVRFWIADLKGVGDWAMFAGLAEILIEGPRDDQVMAATHMAEAAVDEMERRGELMRELTGRGWSQDKILADPRFAPLLVVVDEAQVAYGSTAVGDDKRPYGGVRNTSRYFQAIKALHDQGRAVSVQTAEGTQDPTDQNLPKRSREGNHIRCSLVVGTEAQSKMALGEAAVKNGAAPHELRQGLDKGTLVVAGDGVELPPGQSSLTIRTHYIGPDDAHALAERAKARRRGVETNGGPDDGGEPVPVDVLADVISILRGEQRARSEEVVHRLKTLRPEYYREWTTTELTAALRPVGAEPYKTSGTMHVSLARVREAMADRDAAGETEAESA